MINIDLIRSDPDLVRAAMVDRGECVNIDAAAELDLERRKLVTDADALRAQRNEGSRQLGKSKERTAALVEEMRNVGSQIKTLEQQARKLEEKLHDILLTIPNIPSDDTPKGGDDSGNVVTRTEGEIPNFEFDPLPHWEIAERHGLIDFERGAKVTGAGFPFYIGQGARLQRALIALFLDLATEVGYTEVQAPILVNEASGIGTGQLPDKEGQMYHTAADDLYMVPTAEVPLTNYLRDEILPPDALPIKYTGYTPCFRREAGSYGKDVRGLNRLHQFDKVELVRFVHPDESYEHLEELREDAERAVQALDLPYRRLVLASGDLGVTQAKTYDLEVWSAGQGRWLEVSSVSNFESYQARRANVRFRPAEGEKPQFVHTLNGSGLALPRIVAALLENGQQADGSIVLPERLAAYAGFDRIG